MDTRSASNPNLELTGPRRPLPPEFLRQSRLARAAQVDRWTSFS